MRGTQWRMWSAAALVGGMLTGVSTGALAQGAPDEEKAAAPDMHELASRFNATRVKKDYSYIHRPPGDKVVEQPDMDRLLFWTKGGQPDGYAQRRGDSVIYYDAGGQAVRVQRLAPGEGD
ncbi:MAG: hypothetical protein ABF856_06320 [Acetobacter aceti]|uniref:Uncharacterized protein n=1 Tax=Acetobacter aceti TaxID=435 RepID=A0A1U9KLA2_ACEAC|nr:hypothetical protein [Acetobacter aceti]AQS86575.1 hypothetical protein A0U92_15980 [Acetobacter aceti]